MTDKIQSLKERAEALLKVKNLTRDDRDRLNYLLCLIDSHRLLEEDIDYWKIDLDTLEIIHKIVDRR